jgi:hypothetical protein
MTREITRLRERHLAWLLGFAQCDPPKFRSKEFTKARKKFKEIAVVEVWHVRSLLLLRWQDQLDRGEQQSVIEERVDESRFRRQLRLPTEDEVRQIHKWLVRDLAQTRPPKMELNRAINTGDVFLPISYATSPYQPVVFRQSDTYKSVRFVRDEDVYVASALELLSSFGQRVLRCEDQDCDRLFVRIRQMRYCSDRCSARVRMRKHRIENKDAVNARRRERYKDKDSVGRPRK